MRDRMNCEYVVIGDMGRLLYYNVDVFGSDRRYVEALISGDAIVISKLPNCFVYTKGH